MVSTSLASAAAAPLLYLSDLGGDLDGDLLTQEASQLFTKAYELDRRGRVSWTAGGADAHGLGVKLKQ